MITGVVRPVVTECVDIDDPCYHRAQLKVLNRGFMQDAVLRGEDYILMEEYDAAKHGTVDKLTKPTKLTHWERFVAWCNRRWRK